MSQLAIVCYLLNEYYGMPVYKLYGDRLVDAAKSHHKDLMIDYLMVLFLEVGQCMARMRIVVYPIGQQNSS